MKMNREDYVFTQTTFQTPFRGKIKYKIQTKKLFNQMDGTVICRQ